MGGGELSSEADDTCYDREVAELIESLTGLGLTEHEAKILGALMEASPASASWLAKRTGIPRSSAYTTLDGLVAKGLVGTSYRNEVKQFTAGGHEALMDMLEREHQAAERRLEAGRALREAFEAGASDVNVPRIVFFEGVQGLQRVYLSMLREARSAGPMRIIRDEFVWQPGWAFVHSDEWRAKVGRLKARSGLETRLLVNGSPEERGRTDDYARRRATAVRFLPASTRVERFAGYVLDDVVSLLSFDDRALVGVRMANRRLAEGVGALFDAVWAASTPAE